MHHFIRYSTCFLLLLITGFLNTVGAQTPTDTVPGDPGILAVYTMQPISFGAFSQGITGGSVSISAAGVRSVNGTVQDYDFGIPYFQAVFEVSAPTGAVISILNGPDAVLTGSNGGSMNFHIGSTSPTAPFLNTTPSPARTSIGVGGTLTVGNASANPPGTYSGTFYLTFNLE